MNNLFNEKILNKKAGEEIKSGKVKKKINEY